MNLSDSLNFFDIINKIVDCVNIIVYNQIGGDTK